MIYTELYLQPLQLLFRRDYFIFQCSHRLVVESCAHPTWNLLSCGTQHLSLPVEAATEDVGDSIPTGQTEAVRKRSCHLLLCPIGSCYSLGLGNIIAEPVSLWVYT